MYIGSTPYVQDIHFSQVYNHSYNLKNVHSLVSNCLLTTLFQDEDGQSHIEGARFILQSWNVRNSSAEAQLVR